MKRFTAEIAKAAEENSCKKEPFDSATPRWFDKLTTGQGGQKEEEKYYIPRRR